MCRSWVLFCLAALGSSAPAYFPGYVGPDLHVDAGYLTYGTSQIYYIHTALVPASQITSLIFWFQGGPGGSSWIGLAEENGPVEMLGAETARYRPYNWLEAGNGRTAVVYIDNPACIGFSYTTDVNKTRGCHSGDTLAAIQNSIIIPQFFEQAMPQYSRTPFYIAGESWGGEYIPTMAARSSISRMAFFAGVIIGNPVFRCFAASDPAEDGVGDTWTAFNQLYWNGYVSQETYEMWRLADCDSESHRNGTLMPKCLSILNAVEAHDLGADFNPDNRYGDACTGNASLAFASSICPKGDPDSLDARVGLYLNNPKNVAALNSKVKFYEQASYFSYDADLGNLLPYYAQIRANKPSATILIYSGDGDVNTCPFTFTMPCLQAYIKSQSLKRTADWQTWGKNGVTFGRWEQHEYLTYATLRGAGHEVPM